MKKDELIKMVSSRVDKPISEVKEIADEILSAITDTMVKHEPIEIYGFAKFEVVEQSERTVKNPKTGETKINPAKMVPKCRFRPAFKNLIAE